MRKAIVDLLSVKAGMDVATPAGCEWLCNDIEATIGERIGVNTVKRLTGVIGGKDNDDLHARQSTLDIIAHYLGYEDWNNLELMLGETSSDFNVPDGLVNLCELKDGAIVELRWDPDRCVMMRHIGKGQYVIEVSKNSKLAAGDILEVSQAMKGYPLLVKSVIRNGKSLGSYTAAPEYGITSIKTL